MSCHTFRRLILFALLLLIGSMITVAQRLEIPQNPYQENRSIVAPSSRWTQNPQRFREGTTFKDMHVIIRQADDQILLWTLDGNQRFECLKNLALERILTTMQEKPERQYWKIEGEFTEFRNENFVFIRRAVSIPNHEIKNLADPVQANPTAGKKNQS